MSNRFFIDTAYVIALVNHRDQYHEQASELADQFADHPLITTDAVLLEIGNALARGYRQEAVAIIEYFLSADEVDIVSVDHRLLLNGFDLFRKYDDKTWSLVDCISFIVMRERDVTGALTPDRHFEQAGFQTLMTTD